MSSTDLKLFVTISENPTSLHFWDNMPIEIHWVKKCIAAKIILSKVNNKIKRPAKSSLNIEIKQAPIFIHIMDTVKFLCFGFPAVYHCDCTTDWFYPLDNQEVIKKFEKSAI